MPQLPHTVERQANTVHACSGSMSAHACLLPGDRAAGAMRCSHCCQSLFLRAAHLRYTDVDGEEVAAGVVRAPVVVAHDVAHALPLAEQPVA